VAVTVGPASDIDAHPAKLGAFEVTWFDAEGTALDSEWLTREEFEEMKVWFAQNGWTFNARYVQRAHLGPEALARLIQEY
jgi:hypothetical protein